MPSPAPTNMITGTVFADTNKNGVWNSGEPGVAGVVVTITNIAPTPAYTAQATSASNGSYSLTVPPKGTYEITAVAPSGFLITKYEITVEATPQEWGVKNFPVVPAVIAVNQFATIPASGIPATVQAVYHVGQAPAVAYFDARNIAETRTRNSVTWNFGDVVDLHNDPRGADPLAAPGQYPPVDANTGIVGPVAAHLYRSPGTYTVTATTLDGVKHPITVIVAPDARTQVYFDVTGSDSNAGTVASPWLTAAKFLEACNGSNVHVHATPACKFALPNCVQICTNIVIDVAGAIINPPPGGTAFAGWPGRTADVVILNANIDSPGTTTSSGNHPFIAAVAGTQYCNLRGQRIALVGGSLGCLDRAIQISDDATDGILLQDITQANAYSINSQVIYSGGENHLCEYFLTFLGSNSESCDRDDGDGKADGMSTLYCHFSQPVQAKAAFVDRAGNGKLFARNYVANAEASWGVGIGDPAQTVNVRITDVGIFDNVFRQSVGMGDAAIVILPGDAGITIDFNDIQRLDGGSVIAVTQSVPQAPLPAPTDIIIGANNVYRGKFAAPVAVSGVTVQ